MSLPILNLPVQEIKYVLADYGLHPKLPEVPDSSMLNDFLNCESMFYHAHVLGLRKKGPVPAHFEWGTRWHNVMYTYYHDYDVSEALDVLVTDWPSCLDDLDPKNRTLDRMVTAFQRYVKERGEPERADWSILRREQYFDVECPEHNESCPFPWKGCGLRYCGRWDRVDTQLRSGNSYIRDYKTTSYLAADFYDKLRVGIQIPGYVWAQSHIIPDHPARRATIDVLHCTKTKLDIPLRREFRYTDEELEEWVWNVKRIWAKILFMYEHFADNPDAWTKDWNECKRLWPCNFLSVHHTPDIRDTRLRILSQDYKEDRWNPADIVD